MRGKVFDEHYFEEEPGSRYDYENKKPFFESLALSIKQVFPEVCRVLDIRCGRGYLVYTLNAIGVTAFGVDASIYALTHSPQDVKEKLILSDVETNRIPFRRKSFDMITLISVIEHIKRLDSLLDEIKTLLLPGGICILSTTDYHGQPTKDPTHVNLHSREFWINLFTTQDFKHLSEAPLLEALAKRNCLDNIPNTKYGKILFSFGKFGYSIRNCLGNWILLKDFRRRFSVYRLPNPS